MGRYEVCSCLVLRNNNDPFLERIIICDEKLITFNNLITPESYCQQLEKMNQKLSRKRPPIINSKGPILLYDNTKRYEILSHSVYSPELVPIDFYFFNHLDNLLSENILRKDGELKIATEAFIESRNQEIFANGINLNLVGDNMYILIVLISNKNVKF
uniref:Uncharacterized protein n=1 Tax=Strongyloides venezuelensis TaxID=75913 RepID=A0A0K0EV62_STRVS